MKGNLRGSQVVLKGLGSLRAILSQPGPQLSTKVQDRVMLGNDLNPPGIAEQHTWTPQSYLSIPVISVIRLWSVTYKVYALFSLYTISLSPNFTASKYPSPNYVLCS